MNATISDEVKMRIAAVMASEFHGTSYRLLLFGSRCRGTGSVRSDYDLGIDAHEPLPFERMARLRDSLDQLPYLQRFDLVDLNGVSPRFSSEVQRGALVLDEH